MDAMELGVGWGEGLFVLGWLALGASAKLSPGVLWSHVLICSAFLGPQVGGVTALLGSGFLLILQVIDAECAEAHGVLEGTVRRNGSV